MVGSGGTTGSSGSVLLPPQATNDKAINGMKRFLNLNFIVLPPRF